MRGRPVREPKNLIKSSEFIDPNEELYEDQILALSTIKNRYVPSPDEDHTELPSHYSYNNFIDLNDKYYKGANQIPEQPLPPEEIELYTLRSQRIMQREIENGPNYDLSEYLDQKVADSDYTLGQIFEALDACPFRQELIEFIISFQSINRPGRRILGRAKIKPKNKQEEIRHRIIECYNAGLTQIEIYRKFKDQASSKLIRSAVQIAENHLPEVLNLGFRSYMKRLTKEHVQYILQIAEDPKYVTMSLKERALIVNEKFGTCATSQEIRQVMHDYGYSKKNLRGAVPEADNIPHKNARCRIVKELIRQFELGKMMISVDETQVDRGELNRQGYSKRGSNAISIARRRGKTLHIIAAASKYGILGYMLRNDRIDDYAYKFFLTQLFDKIKRQFPDSYELVFLLMDNAKAHKTKIVKDFIESQHYTVICNAPMTPQIQPIEYLFSMLKAGIAGQIASDPEQLNLSIFRAFQKISYRKIYNTFVHTIRYYEEALNFRDLHDGRQKHTEGRIKKFGKSMCDYIKLDGLRKTQSKDEFIKGGKLVKLDISDKEEDDVIILE